MNFFYTKVQKQQEINLPFVLYCKPNSDTVFGLLQQNDFLHHVLDYTENGFVFAPFDGNQTVLIPENQSEKISFVFEQKEVNVVDDNAEIINEIEKYNFQKLVVKGIQAIKKGELKKVVLSRKESVDLADFDLISTFQKLVQFYPATFVYCFFHPKIGTWLGATPEQLLKTTENFFETVALAGTQKDNGFDEIIWKLKEKEEQQFVTDYIVSELQEVASEVVVSNPYNSKAGTIWHIKTDISGKLHSASSLQKVIHLLHPTPAVCGLPKQESKAFIIANENYNRTFYTGFLGELNTSLSSNALSSSLFVNLRCMEIVDSKVYLYMGCGITKDSIPEKEWEESVNKSMTIKRVIRK